MRLYKVDQDRAIFLLADMVRADVAELVSSEIGTARAEFLASFEESTLGVEDLSLRIDEMSEATPEAGEKGEKGDKGDPGLAGAAGLEGRAGRLGDPGKKGRDGTDGKRGPEGKTGVAGKAGKNGSPDSPEQVAAKLNKTEESVDTSVIRGLAKFMAEIRAALRSAGKGKPAKKLGGGGNIVEYADLSSQCDGATRTFTIPRCRRVVSVHCSQAPWIFRPTVDWTATATTLVLDPATDFVQPGQTLSIIYIH